MTLFTLALAACTVAPTASLLITARVVPGAGAAILTPSTSGVAAFVAVVGTPTRDTAKE